MTPIKIAVTAAALLAMAGCARSIPVTARLSANQEVPPTQSGATGTFNGTFYPSTRALDYTLSYDNLTTLPTAAHLHGPAPAGQNAPVVIPFTVTSTPTPVPITGSATLTEAQAADLMAGNYYANVHTRTYPNGEMRGQVTH